jgi:hypothetical protein
MKKIVTFIVLMCMVLALVACNDNGNTTSESTSSESTSSESTSSESNITESSASENTAPEITLQEVYDAGKNIVALLGDHESVFVKVMSNGKIIREEYLSKQYHYSYSSAEYMNMGIEYASLTTDHAVYVCLDNDYSLNVTLAQNGIVDTKEQFAQITMADFISNEIVNNENASITEKDGSIIVTFNADMDKIVTMGEDIVSCVETYTLDAQTREMTAVKTVYTYKDGTVEEGVATITRDVEAPEGAKPFFAYENETENLRTVTIVSNPGAENEKTETIKAPKGLAVGFAFEWKNEKTFTMYADAACTQVIEEDPDVNSDLTVYIKWAE